MSQKQSEALAIGFRWPRDVSGYRVVKEEEVPRRIRRPGSPFKMPPPSRSDTILGPRESGLWIVRNGGRLLDEDADGNADRMRCDGLYHELVDLKPRKDDILKFVLRHGLLTDKEAEPI